MLGLVEFSHAPLDHLQHHHSIGDRHIFPTFTRNFISHLFLRIFKDQEGHAATLDRLENSNRYAIVTHIKGYVKSHFIA
jgi:hypothetical protein